MEKEREKYTLHMEEINIWLQNALWELEDLPGGEIKERMQKQVAFV
jgi:hypothetical protein